MKLDYSKIEYNTGNVVIETNGFSFKKDISVEKGTCVGIAVHPFTVLPNQNIDISIETPQGKPILSPVDIRDFAKTNAPGIDAYKRVFFPTNGLLKVIVNSPQALRIGFNCQVVFVIQID